MRPEDRQLQAAEDFRWLLETEQGRRLLWSIIDGMCGAVGSTFVGEDTHASAYREGRRSIGLKLLSKAQSTSRRDSVAMLAEAFSRTEEDRLDRERTSKEREDGRGTGRRERE